MGSRGRRHFRQRRDVSRWQRAGRRPAQGKEDIIAPGDGSGSSAEAVTPPAAPVALSPSEPAASLLLVWPQRDRVAAWAVTALFVIAVLYTLHFARPLLVPLTAALILGLLLAPLVRALRRLRLPEPAAAALVMLVALSSMAGGVTVLADPAEQWMSELPRISRDLQRKFRLLREPIADMREASKQVENLTTLESPREAPQRVVVAEGGLFAQTVGVVQSIGSSLGILFATLYFLLATQSLLRDKLERALPDGKGRRTVAVVRSVQRNLSTYLITISLINAGLGVATGLALWALGMPNPVLWGVMASILNFIPLLGAVIGVGVTAAVALITYPTLLQALLPPAAYLGLHLIESQLLTPYVVGRRLTMNPIAVFLAIVFWTWLWGIPGGLMAVPLLAMLKVVCDAVEGLKPLATLIGGHDDNGDCPPRRNAPLTDAR